MFSLCALTHTHTHTHTHTRTQNGHVQLVLLDHGLYKSITDSFRLEYAALWRALIFADADGIRRHSAAMNAGMLVWIEG